MIQIDDNYRIIMIPRNFVLQQKVNTNKPHRLRKNIDVEQWKDIGYSGTISHLISLLLNTKALESQANSIKELKDEIHEYAEQISFNLHKYYKLENQDHE